MISESDHKKLADFVETTTGIQLPSAKRYLIEGRLGKRQRALGCESISTYLKFVLKNPEGKAERQHLIDVLTTNKTNFFREKDHFDLLHKNVLNHILAERTKKEDRPLIRVWSAGCSSGEEVYTLAMVMLEAKEHYRNFDFQIMGSDICTRVLKTAASAVYTEQDIEPVPKHLRNKYFLKHVSNPNQVKMGPELRKVVHFSQVNLLQEPFNFSSTFDVIFCRNLMIYFNDRDRNILLGKLRQILSPWGTLFVGHSERVNESFHKLKIVAPAAYMCER